MLRVVRLLSERELLRSSAIAVLRWLRTDCGVADLLWFKLLRSGDEERTLGAFDGRELPLLPCSLCACSGTRKDKVKKIKKNLSIFL